jgi:amino acid transporter
MKKSFWLWSAVFLWIGSMVWAWIFVLLWETWAIAWNLVWISFILWWIIALLSWYSMAKLAGIYPSRWWIVEYLVQCYWTWIFSWTISVLFYISALVGLTMVAKTFWTYLSMMLWYWLWLWVNIFSIWIIVSFVFINLLWSKLIAKSENIIVILKLSILIIFILATSYFVNPELLKIDVNSPIFDILSSIWLAFFAFEWFRAITNTAEDIEDPEKNILKAMVISIIFVLVLYIAITIVVFWNLSLWEIIKAKDYALAEAAKPILWQIWFTIIAIAALISTASSINANLYAITNVSYNMAKNWELPKQYSYNVYHSTEWLVISSIFIIIFILFFDLSEVASIWAISMLFIHLLVHIWHLFKIKETKASKILIYLAILTISTTIILAYNYMSKHIDNLWYLIIWSFILAFLIEISLRLFTWREINKQTDKKIFGIF